MTKIVQHWPDCRKALTHETQEDDITNNLVHRLCKDAEVRDIGWPEAQYVPLVEIQGSTAVEAKGYIDIALIIDGNRDTYLAYECKRLNVVYDTGRHSLATKYVTEGLKRFIQQQYSSALPTASMLGYVMDGDAEFAKKSVHKAINDSLTKTELTCPPTEIESLGASTRFRTGHCRIDGSDIEVTHSFLSF